MSSTADPRAAVTRPAASAKHPLPRFNAAVRLFDLDWVASYLNVSRWTAEELIRSGAIPVTRIPRPRTARALKHDPAGDELRLLRVDRADLDAFIEQSCRKERLGVEYGR